MGYPMDLDEYCPDWLVDELRQRARNRLDDKCDYCHRPTPCDPPCRFAARQTDEQDLVVEILEERERQERKFPEQHLPGHSPEILDKMPAMTEYQKETVNRAAANGSLCWFDVLLEEVFEAGEETEPLALIAELVQVAAVAVRWAEDVRRTFEVECDHLEFEKGNCIACGKVEERDED